MLHLLSECIMLPETAPKVEISLQTFIKHSDDCVRAGQNTDHTLKLRASQQQTPLMKRREALHE